MTPEERAEVEKARFQGRVTLSQQLESWIGAEYHDDEIIDMVERWWIHEHTPRGRQPMVRAIGDVEPRSISYRSPPPAPTSLPLRWRHVLAEWLTERRGVAGPTMTTDARRYIPLLNAEWRAMDRPSRRKVAELVGIDRGTVARWIKHGWLRLPPD